MLKGLFTSIFGATDQGIFDALYSDYGASPPVKSTEIRLGDYGEDAAPSEKDDEDEKPAATPSTPTAAKPSAKSASAPPMSAAPAPGQASGFFSQDIAGFPLWLVGVAFLGFAWSYRRKRKKQSSRRK
jgi:pyruvate/2-oxoglutarate dehydrogenase complex dihydrolipoamide acyltransferase (E2) component